MIDALAFAATLWTHPGMAPCATDAGNPCWTGPIPTEAGEICDGDLILNTGARDGRMIGPFPQIVALDVGHLIAKGYRFRRDGERTCIPSLTDGEAHLIEACKNRAIVLARDSIAGRVLPTYAMTPLRLTEGAATVATPRGGAHTPIVPLPRSVGLLLGALAALALVGMKPRA